MSAHQTKPESVITALQLMIISIAVTLLCGGIHIASLMHTPMANALNPGQMTAATVIIGLVLWVLTSQVIRQRTWALYTFWVIEVASIIATTLNFNLLMHQGTLILVAALANLVMIAAALILFLKKDARQWLKHNKT